MPKFLSPIDLNKCELQNAAVHNLATAPADPVEGQLWQDTTNHQLKVWNGSAWIIVYGTAGTVTSVSGTAPIASSGGATPAISLNDDGVTNAKLDNMAANTLKGNATAGSANPTDIALAANQFLARSSTGNIAAKPVTDVGLSILDDATIADVLATLGLTGATRKYTDGIPATAANTPVNMTHGLGTAALAVTVYVTATGEIVYPNITLTSTYVILTFATAITEDQYTVVAIG